MTLEGRSSWYIELRRKTRKDIWYWVGEHSQDGASFGADEKLCLQVPWVAVHTDVPLNWWVMK